MERSAIVSQYVFVNTCKTFNVNFSSDFLVIKEGLTVKDLSVKRKGRDTKSAVWPFGLTNFLPSFKILSRFLLIYHFKYLGKYKSLSYIYTRVKGHILLLFYSSNYKKATGIKEFHKKANTYSKGHSKKGHFKKDHLPI